MRKDVPKYIFLLFLLIIPFSLRAEDDSFQSAFVPDDIYYNRQWYLSKINADNIWNKNTSKAELVVAVIDSGVQVNHPDLRDNIWINLGEISNNGIDDDQNGYIDDVNGWDFISNSSDPSPKISQGFIEEEVVHGTVVAGIIAATVNNQKGITGLAQNVKIMPLLALSNKGIGNLETVIEAIDYAIDNGADIINLSFIGESYSASFEAAIRRAFRAGIFIVAAAGNDNEEQQGIDLDQHPLYPVCNDGYYWENMVFGVAATDALDQKASFSGFGAKCVDVSAPGVSIFSTSFFAPTIKDKRVVLNSYYDGYWSGTSMATPLVSATVALVVGTNPSLSSKEAASIIQGASDYIEKLNPQYIGMLGSGRLNVGRAVAMSQELLDIKDVKIINSPFSATSSSILISDIDGGNKRQFNVLGSYVGGTNTAVGDVDGDGVNEIIVGAGFNGGPLVQVFSHNYKLISQFFAYDKDFRGGVNVAVGDINGDGLDDIVTGAGRGGGPHVKAFNGQGELLGQFFAYDKDFRGGVNVAVGDINGDGLDDIVTGADKGGGPQVRVFDKSGSVISQFFAYDKDFRGGVNVATADIDGGLRKYDEIITSPASSGGAHIRIFNHFGILISEFFAYSKKYRGRTNIATGDINKDGLDEIVTGAGIGGTPHVRVFKSDGTLLKSYMAYADDFSGGVNVAVIDY